MGENFSCGTRDTSDAARRTRNLRRAAYCATVLAQSVDLPTGRAMCATVLGMAAYTTGPGPATSSEYSRAARRVSWALTRQDPRDPWAERLALCAMVADHAVAVWLDWAGA